VDSLVLGCTHYPIFKKEIKKLLPKSVKVISQDEIVPKKLKEYLKKHSGVANVLSKKRETKILVTDMTHTVSELTKKWFGKEAKVQKIDLN
jgi:glutamate racemase